MMAQARFIRTQLDFAAHVRDPQNRPSPQGVEDRRMAIYRDLVYKNIESFIASGFPVLRSILEDNQWHQLIRDFIRDYRCGSPYFLDIGKEFLCYLQEVRSAAPWEPPFMAELCHYEWVELALDIANDQIPENQGTESDPLKMFYRVSPLVWRLSYSYPVHRISKSNQPDAPISGGVFLIVYRNRQDQVRFLEVNGVVITLLQYIDNKKNCGHDLLLDLSVELGFDDTVAFLAYGADMLAQLVALDVLVRRQ
ncbi:MAG: putative DNA-binding domain-containing protein [Porticoccaceae bacterium]|nr:putative DNA-binding domain-containing protein [Porticoccaceae bacterium]